MGCGKAGKGKAGKGGKGGFGVAQDSAVCSIHGKKRTVSNLMDDGNGGMCCTPEAQCKTDSDMMGLEPDARELLICSVHGKKRTKANLTDDGMGGFCCLPTHQCNVGKGG